MSFLDLTFPRGIAGHVTGGPERRVDIVALSSGDEERNARWRDSRRSYDASFGVRKADDLAKIVALFEEVGGPLHSFRFRDWSDFSSAPSTIVPPTSTDQQIGTGDGTTTQFQLAKAYGNLAPYTREITKPVAGTVLISLDGVAQASGWAVVNNTGIVTFSSPPAAGVTIAAGYLFDVPVRFDTKKIEIDMAFFSETSGHATGDIPSIPLVEVRE